MATRGGSVRAAGATRRTKRPAKVLHLGHPAVLVGSVTFILLTLGLVMILSASSVQSFATYGSSFLYFQKQLLWACLGLVAYIVLARTDYRKLRRVAYPAYVLCAGALLLVLVPGIGVNAGGSARWLGVGPLTFQPSELAKLGLVLMLAEAYTRKRESSLREAGHALVPLVPALGVLALLVMMQPDLGTTVLLGSVGFGIVLVAGAPARFLAPVALGGTVLALGLAMSESYRRARILSFLDPWKDPLNTGYQTIQSLIALGSGGWFGVGLGASRQKWMYVPNAHTDFIFAILGEEMGLLGTFTVVGLFVFLMYLGVRVAQRAPDRFGMLVAAGITIWVSIQALVNMGAVTAALPITGVPLPLVSFGGSSLLVTLAAMGILTNIASQARFTTRKKRPSAATS